jgi:hypothetical protein
MFIKVQPMAGVLSVAGAALPNGEPFHRKTPLLPLVLEVPLPMFTA